MAEPTPPASAPAVSPRCPQFGRCGGCGFQDREDAALAEWKRARIVAALMAEGVTAEVVPSWTAPPNSRRKAKLALQRRKSGEAFGFRARASHEIVDIAHCAVLAPAILDALPGLRSLARIGAPRKRAVCLSVTVSDAGLDVTITDGKAMTPEVFAALGAAAETLDLARLSYSGETVAQRRPPVQRFGASAVVPPPGAFLQAVPQAERLMQRIVREAIPEEVPVADLFCGCGTFALPLAAKNPVLACDSEADAVAALDRAARETPGLRKVVARRRDLFRRPLHPEELRGIGAVVFDPPRAGAKAQVENLANSGVPLLVAVSCDPVSFARDARILVSGGYRIGRLLPIDQFLWSDHVELIALFRKRE